MMDFRENEVFDFARCQRPDGSTYGTAGVCRKGKPISATKVAELVQKAKAMGYNDKDIKAVADKVREKYGVKILKGDALASAARRLGEEDGIAPKGKKKAAPKKKPEPKAKKEKAAPKAASRDRHEKIARDVMADKAFKSDKQRIAEMVRRGVPKNTDFVALIADAKANQPSPKPAPKAKKAAPKVKAKKEESYVVEQGKKIPQPGEAGLRKGVREPEKGEAYDPKKNWDKDTNQKLGQGAFGSAVRTDGPPPGIIKKGDIGEFEADVIAKMQDVDGFPTLHGQNITGQVRDARYAMGNSVATATGYLAMSEVDGKPMFKAGSDGVFRRRPEAHVQAMDEYLRIRKEMHMRGVAHNDMHMGNFFYNPETGKASIVDFGLAQMSPRAAFFEAWGTDGRTGTDFQATRFRDAYDDTVTGKGLQSRRLARFEANQERAERRLIQLGYDVRMVPEIRTNLRTGRGIRGSWENFTDEHANELLGILYDGV